MTSRDIMPFGKHEGKRLGEIPRTYFVWLFDQDGTEEKFPELFDWFCDGDTKTGSTQEIESNNIETTLLNSLPDCFSKWWFASYGDRLRSSGPDFYIPYLRVAVEAWTASSKILANETLIKQSPAAQEAVRAVTPPPAAKPTPKPSHEIDLDTGEINF